MTAEPISINRNLPGFVGENFKRHQDIADVAKVIRKELKARYAGWTFGVTISRYSMGQSMTVRIKGVPAGVEVRNPEFDNNVWPPASRWTPAVDKTIREIESLLASYNRNNSDSQTDYFDVNFYGSVVVEVGE